MFYVACEMLHVALVACGVLHCAARCPQQLAPRPTHDWCPLHTATLHIATLLVACCNIACYLLQRRSFGEFGKERLLRGGLTFHAAELVDEAAVADEVHC